MKRLAGVLALLACGPVLALLTCGSGLYECGQCCKDYVACAYKTGAPPGSLDSSFGANGSCWTTTSSADNCNAACLTGVNQFKSSGIGADAGCRFGM
jgi:hypothetical protein